MRPKMNAPTGRNARVSVIESAIAASDLPNSRAIAVSVITTRKKSNASSVQPRNPATTAARWSAAAGRTAVIGVLPEDPLDYTHALGLACLNRVLLHDPRGAEPVIAAGHRGDQSPVRRAARQRAPSGRHRGRGGGDEQAACDAGRVRCDHDRRFERYRNGRGRGGIRWQSV